MIISTIVETLMVTNDGEADDDKWLNVVTCDGIITDVSTV